MAGSLLIAALVLLPVIGFIGWKLNSLYRAAQHWRRLANEHGLSFEANGLVGEFELSGTYRDVFVRVRTETSWGSSQPGDRKEIRTQIKAQLPDDAPADFVMSPSGDAVILEALLGAPESIAVGLPEIDDSFTVRTDRPDEVRDYFDRPELGDAFETLSTAHGRVEVAAGSVAIERSTFVDTSFELETLLDTATEFVLTLRDISDDEADESDRSAGDESTINHSSAEAEHVTAWD